MPTLDIWLTSAAYAIVLGVLLFFASQPLLGILQQEGYCGSALLRWHYRKNNEVRKRYLLLTLCSVLLTALFSLCFAFAGREIALLLALIAYAGLIVLFVYSFRHALKVPLKRTARVLRLSVCLYLLLAVLLFGAEIGLFALAEVIGHPLAYALLRSVPLALAPLLLPVLVAAANGIMKCYEIPHTNKFIRLAAQKLAASDCIKVGITGSFAKTSVKHFSAEILSEKYRVFATPLSYNTPVGIAKCVNENGVDCDIFLAEMGARKRGDIKELCDMVCPSYAVVTGICPQHLETFGSIEAIRAEKGELAKCATHVVLGETAKDFAKEGALVAGHGFETQNVVLTTEGTSFDLVLGGERVHIQTKLLGRHAAEDVALAATLAHLLGMELKEIAEAANSLKAVPHRLERIEGNGVHILDDSYNSNVAGARDAVETLKLFEGKKYVVTPGLVELGELEEKENADLGAQFVGLDGVILVGETLVLSVRQGYLNAGGDDAKLKIVPSLDQAQKLLAAELSGGDAVLFLNDLPDKYL